MGHELKGDISVRHKWKESSYYPFDTPLLNIPCSCKLTPGAKRVLNLPLEIKEKHVIVYNNCQRTLFAAMKRQVMGVPLPDPAIAKDFQQFAVKLIEDKMGAHLRNFDYSYTQWYNHVNAFKQKLLNTMNDDSEYLPCKYSMFCKREIQLVDGGPGLSYDDYELPKNRAIAGPREHDKFVMGPATWALESLFNDHFPGYCGNKNWQEQEDQIKEWANEGYIYTIQGDGSGWDRTMHQELKFIDYYIYTCILPSIHHVSKECWQAKTLAQKRKMVGEIMSKNGKKKFLSAILDATVTSGNPDTTLMNTIRLSIVLHYIMDKANIKDFKIMCKGDDFCLFTKKDYSTILTPIFYKYWSKKGENVNKPHGLGLILKFLTFGMLDDFDFCSTNLIWDRRTNDVKIVRQLVRMQVLTAYSRKALSFSKQEQSNYMRDQAMSIESWANGLPFYGEFVDAIRKAYPIEYKLDAKHGPAKQILPYDGRRLREMRDPEESGYGRDFDYGKMTRVSNNKIDPAVVKQFLLDKYHWTDLDSHIYFERLSVAPSH